MVKKSSKSNKQQKSSAETTNVVVDDTAVLGGGSSPEKLDSDEDFDPDVLDNSPFNHDGNEEDENMIEEENHSVAPGTSNVKDDLLSTSTEPENSPEKKKKKSPTKKRGLSPLLELFDVVNTSASKTNFGSNGGTAYLSYNEDTWSPLFLYRLPADIALSTIRDHGTEGIGRIEIGWKMGMDTSTKAGNRRVSSYILTACNEHPQHIGQFQKMEGKIRCIKYFWKADKEPEQFKKLFDDFEKFAGVPCPFKLGQVMKFPNCNLSTLRISDVTLRRLNDILEMIATKRVIVTVHKISRFISSREQSYGYDFTIDKKSLLKCLKALESANLLTVFETNVAAESVETKVQIVCHPDIFSPDDPEVLHAIQATIDEYHKEGRVFPHGQLRFSIKKKAEMEAKPGLMDPFDNIVKECSDGIHLSQRYNLLRLQMTRCSTLTQKKPTDPELADKDDLTFVEEKGTVPSNGTTDLNKTGASASSPGPNSKPPQDVEHPTEFGYQSKAIRCFVVHEIAFQLVFGHPVGTKPNLYELFPPSESFSTWPVRGVDDLSVFVDEESPLRFLPHLPPFSDVQRGWFMVQDFLAALPLSVFVLIAHVSRKINKNMLQSYLSDPIKRHICVGCLPNEIRIPILKDKKVVRQVEHIMLTNCAMGLMAIATNPDVKRFSSPRSSVFYVSRKAVLYDTSTSGRGYASVTLPLSRYDKYDYEFNTIDDIALYWHHLRAIVQSTPLSFRNDANAEEIHLARHKKYSMGLFDKNLVIRDPSDSIDEIIPLGPREGCAGFDSALYIHLRRHWDIDPRQNSCVGWYIARFRRQSDKSRSVVECRVAKMKKDTNGLSRKCQVLYLMPNEIEPQKAKKRPHDDSGDATYSAPRKVLASDLLAKRKPPFKKVGQSGRRKRQLDSVDIISEQNRFYLRSRFSSRERDMLILIRAVSFFLNPVYRFWLNPSVVRDIMHEYIPESRCKTVQSLMAAAVREMVRPGRLAYLQRIVRNLSTFQEMRDLRFLLASSPLTSVESKASFFKNAFDVANRLLFMESQVLPVTATSDKQFENFLNSSGLIISTEQSVSSPVPMRARVPTTLARIHHCVAVNLLLSILIHSADEAFSEAILDQISPSVLCNALQVLKTDGLVSRSRVIDHQLMVITKNKAVLSYYFRHFFTHRFHPDIMEQALSMFDALDESVQGIEELQGDLVGLLVAAASSFYNNSDLEICVDEEVFTTFEQAVRDQATQSIKQIRYLENTNLHLEQIHIFESSPFEQPELPSWLSILPKIDWSQPASNYPQIPFEDFLLNVPVYKRKGLRAVYEPIVCSAENGAKLSEIEDATNMSREDILSCIRCLTDGSQVISVGVDAQRWVSADFALAWCVKVGGRIVSPRPWTMPTGEISPATVRWMAESILMTVVSSPGITLKEVCFRLQCVLQPIAIHDLITVLEVAGCIVPIEEVFEDISLSSVFQEECPEVKISYLLPTVDCLEKFSRIFGRISLLPGMVGRGESDKQETQKSGGDGDSEDVKEAVPVLQEAQ
ncbi:hypothetical protein KIN20_002439 [Parelaphostrongylus tenuis]|uniref:GTF3C1 extended winged-helix domain-containing protein n=1 Tax=Parelaphostrongylus tenuis TaxID=148309 RepID=A0AAD5QD09_PARTN|nr:hypothetical protein KIN20_002439 [Parelaphostrongylus tenuis]